MDKKTKRAVLIALSIVAAILAILAWPVYFATQLSDTYSHIKDYECSGIAKELEKEIVQLTKYDSRFAIYNFDSTGTENDRNYYMTIEQNLDHVLYAYHITYSNEGEKGCTLGLVGVFDKTNNAGGYQDVDKDVDILVGVFEKEIIGKLSVIQR
jgi:hypothetical protein